MWVGSTRSELSLADEIESLRDHDHLCLIYESLEGQQAAMILFTSIGGLEDGDEYWYVAGTHRFGK